MIFLIPWDFDCLDFFKFSDLPWWLTKDTILSPLLLLPHNQLIKKVPDHVKKQRTLAFYCHSSFQVLRPCNRRTSRKMTSPGESSATTLPSPSPTAAGRKKEATTMTLARSCALILISLTTSASVAAGSEMPLVDPLYHFNPCSFNPQCLCSTGGERMI